jgi:hypothetical protein
VFGTKASYSSTGTISVIARADAQLEISQVFLGATAQDCRVYRQDVRDFIQDNVPAAKLHLQEDWAEGGQIVEDTCRRKLDESDGYLGLFGYRYGYRPPGREHSITELEFRHAVHRWPGREQPIFILRAELGSESDRHLRAAADALYECDPPEHAARDRAAQMRFLQTVSSWASTEGHLLVIYNNHRQLLGKALSCIQNWNLELLRRASTARRTLDVADIPSDELGRIGRAGQQEALRGALEAFRAHADQRAAAFLVHGPENHGQRELADFICRWQDEWEDAAVHCGRPMGADGVASLTAWACSCLGAPTVVGTPSIDELAALLAARLAKSSVVFVLRSLGRHPQRLAHFQHAFWEPLRRALAARKTKRTGRLYWFLVEHEPHDETVPRFRTRALDAADVDYDEPLVLPVLAPLTRLSIMVWLKELQRTAGIRLDETARREIAEAVTLSGTDNFPANVYNRLALHGFWGAAS